MGLFDGILRVNPDEPDNWPAAGAFPPSPPPAASSGGWLPSDPQAAADRLRRVKAARARQKSVKRAPRPWASPSGKRKHQVSAYKGIVRGHQGGRRCTGQVATKGGGSRRCFRTATKGTKCPSHKQKVRRVRGGTGRSGKRRAVKRRKGIKKTSRKKKYKGRKYTVWSGSRGGKFIRAGGRKVYI